jgi:general secretion pathway protein J
MTSTHAPHPPRRPARPRAHSRSGGFTLVEVLVALAILAIMAAMSWQGVDMVLRSREIALTRMDALLRLQTVMAQWESDLGAVIDTRLLPRAFEVSGNSVRLTRRHPEGVQLVAWTLRDNRWQRWAAEPVTGAAELQDAWLRSQQLVGNEPGTLTALEGIEQVQVFEFRGGSLGNAQSSGDAAEGTVVAGGAATQRISLPDGVELQLGFAPGQGLGGTLTRDVRIAPHARN